MYLWYLEGIKWLTMQPFVSSNHDGLMALDPRSFLNYIRGTMWNPIKSHWIPIDPIESP